ncbi:hypothetical protein EV2_011858 [Malus domestica]
MKSTWPRFHHLLGFPSLYLSLFLHFVGEDESDLRENPNRKDVPLLVTDEKDVTNGHLEKTTLKWIPGMKHMRLKDMPNFIRSTDLNDIAFNRCLEEAQDILTADAIVFNTFYEFESEVLDTVSAMFSNICNLSFLNTLCSSLPQTETNSRRSSLWEENTECLAWLDTQKPNSIVYLNFGSIAMMIEDNLKEFA